MSNITVKDEHPTGGNDPAYAWRRDLALYYWADHTLRAALWGQWQVDVNGDPIPETYEMLHAREFRYEWMVGSPRERYLTVDGNPNAPNADPNHPETYGLIEPVRLTDYLADTPYGDADVTNDGGWSVTGSMRYLFPGAQETVGTGAVQYWHGDMIGSTMLTTDESGAPSLPGVGDGVLAYTAFGEILDASGLTPLVRISVTGRSIKTSSFEFTPSGGRPGPRLGDCQAAACGRGLYNRSRTP